MTGKDLIVYILQNDLEDAPVFEDGRLLGFMTALEAAVKMDATVTTVHAWVQLGYLQGIMIGTELYIPGNAERPTVEK